MNNLTATISKPLLTVVQKEKDVIPLLTAEEKTTLDILAKIFVTSIIAENETSHCIHKNI